MKFLATSLSFLAFAILVSTQRFNIRLEANPQLSGAAAINLTRELLATVDHRLQQGALNLTENVRSVIERLLTLVENSLQQPIGNIYVNVGTDLKTSDSSLLQTLVARINNRRQQSVGCLSNNINTNSNKSDSNHLDSNEMNLSGLLSDAAELSKFVSNDSEPTSNDVDSTEMQNIISRIRSKLASANLVSE